jgi:hypothetical protein
MSTKNKRLKIEASWLGRPVFDLVFIISPPFISLIFIMLFPSLFVEANQVDTIWWILLILFIDVAHVYSTLFRTYFSKTAWLKYRLPMMLIPFGALMGSIILCSISISLFWSVMAYIAVFHFIRQQYGIFKLYNRGGVNLPNWCTQIDVLMIYSATLYPIVYWHLSSPRNFEWFVSGDFYQRESPVLRQVVTYLYWLIVSVFGVKEIWVYFKTKIINLPKILVMLGTMLSWYFGIVYFNGDMAFTLLNVVSHGIPYMALIWIFARKENQQHRSSSTLWRSFYSPFGIAIFICIIVSFAFVEEWLWDLLVWRERGAVFFSNIIGDIPHLSSRALNFVIPFLVVPQLTHYIIDGFIWKRRTPGTN